MQWSSSVFHKTCNFFPNYLRFSINGFDVRVKSRCGGGDGDAGAPETNHKHQVTPDQGNVFLIMMTSSKKKHFQCDCPFVRGIHRWPVDSPHKGQRTVEQTIETPVIWDAIAPIMTSLWWSLWYSYYPYATAFCVDVLQDEREGFDLQGWAIIGRHVHWIDLVRLALVGHLHSRGRVFTTGYRDWGKTNI